MFDFTEFKGNDMIALLASPDDTRPMQFGRTKAIKLCAVLDQMQAWCDRAAQQDTFCVFTNDYGDWQITKGQVQLVLANLEAVINFAENGKPQN